MAHVRWVGFPLGVYGVFVMNEHHNHIINIVGVLFLYLHILYYYTTGFSSFEMSFPVCRVYIGSFLMEMSFTNIGVLFFSIQFSSVSILDFLIRMSFTNYCLFYLSRRLLCLLYLFMPIYYLLLLLNYSYYLATTAMNTYSITCYVLSKLRGSVGIWRLFSYSSIA